MTHTELRHLVVDLLRSAGRAGTPLTREALTIKAAARTAGRVRPPVLVRAVPACLSRPFARTLLAQGVLLKSDWPLARRRRAAQRYWVEFPGDRGHEPAYTVRDPRPVGLWVRLSPETFSRV